MEQGELGRRIASMEISLIRAKLAKDRRSIAYFRRALAIAKAGLITR